MLLGGTDAAIGLPVSDLVTASSSAAWTCFRSRNAHRKRKSPEQSCTGPKRSKNKEEEEKHFERDLILHQRGMPRIDKDQEKWRLATIGREIFAKSSKLRFAGATLKELTWRMKYEPQVLDNCFSNWVSHSAI
jgi:hypothetical protein